MNIAVIDDDVSTVTYLTDYFARYGQQADMEFRVQHFKDAESFLASYRGSEYSIIFMDIELPGISGIEAAHRLRYKNDSVVLLFITRMAQYAQKGYEVNALDYIVKPLRYADFCLKVKKAINVSRALEAQTIAVQTGNGAICMTTGKIMFVEVMGHQLRFQFVDDVIEVRGTLSDIEKRLAGHGFLRCNNCYLVNVRFVNWVRGYDINVGGHILKISHPRHKQFMKDFMDLYTGGGK